jgi:hypothetical protein
MDRRQQLNRFHVAEIAKISERNCAPALITGVAMNLLFVWLGIAALAAITYGRARTGAGWMILGGYASLLALIAVAVIPAVEHAHMTVASVAASLTAR